MSEEFAACRFGAARAWPYARVGLCALVPVERPGLGTMAVDRYWRVYYDPAVFRRWSPAQARTVLFHELLHLVDKHHERCGDRDPRRWNVGADLAIAGLLDQDPKADLPPEGLRPEAFRLPRGLTAEEYYDRLAAEEAAAVVPPGAASPAPLGGRCGSGATGVPEPWEAPPPGTPGAPPGVSPVEGDLIRREMARQILATARAGIGTVPAELVRWAEEFLGPRHDWRRELAATLRRALGAVVGAVDYSYRRPSRRTTAHPVLLPAMVQPLPMVAVVVDTSGSMDAEALGQALAEIRGILRALGQPVTVLACDTEVHAVSRVMRADRVDLVGGGGTNMGEGLRQALQLVPRPQVVVVLTDGLTPWPETPPPGVQVVVGLLGSGTAPPWARVVHLEKA